MDSASLLRSFKCSVGAVSHVRSVSQKPCMVSAHNAACPTVSKSRIQGLAFGGSSLIKLQGMVVSCIKATETRAAVKSGGELALMLEVCDETEVAELKLKVGDFEMHLKRNIGATKAPRPVATPTSPLPVRSEPVIESSPDSLPSPKSSTENTSPFTNVPVETSAKLAALEASGSSGYDLVLSTLVGTFRRGRTLKGDKQPPICHEGDVIKEGQVIGYMDQSGTELPVKKLLVTGIPLLPYCHNFVVSIPSPTCDNFASHLCRRALGFATFFTSPVKLMI
ncbi:hypothetical protein RHMOL_Rhmol03G0171000 [Rhododendron molle]|uniref:Uncharacterized protein n=1 Tax=Rhododendron molle TaxID=49168 RepID=A0ACC0PIF3_RHOML|nr:hypothetical protein RHMOL_Rhmol03G0171000 [Rhododendron molle]